MSLPYSRAEVKDRARSEWVGACNVTLPSFSSDFHRLNTEAISYDIRRAAEFGFWGTLVASECGTTVDEYIEFLEIAAAAAPKGFRLVAHLSFDTVEDELRVAKAAEALGVEAALLAYPPSFVPTSAKDVVDHTRHVAECTDLALVVFAVMTWGFKRLHPSGFPPEALEEIARLQTAAAVKCELGGSATMSAFADVYRRCAEYVLVENPMEQHAPALVSGYGVQWIGTSAYDSFGNRVPQMFAALRADKWDEAMELFWSYQPARDAKGGFHASFAGAGLIHRVGWKYLAWLHGFSGGLLRMPQMRLSPVQMRSLRAGVVASGFEVPADDQGFYTGRFPQ